jgi:beta-lactamase superfamily II metal-dependent hydrolase
MLKIKVLPANCGDSIIISFKDGAKIKNILVDGGVGRFYKDRLQSEIKRIKDKGQNIDLLIVTHLDNDHINGIIKFIEDKENNGCIKELWFNSWTNFGHKPIKLKHEGKEITAKSAVNLEKALENLGIWNNEIIGQGIYRKYDNAKITVVSPDEPQLENLRGYLDEEFPISESDDRKKSIKFLQKRTFIENNKIPNGSSIAFVFEYYEEKKTRRLLFLGDSFPSVVVNGLEKMNFISDDKNLEVEYVKLSHHGSKGNTSDELLKSIQCNNYIVTTKGCHNHPNKETFARIVKYYKPLNIFFNHKTKKTKNIFFPDELIDYDITQNYLMENWNEDKDFEPYVIKVC